MGLVLSMVRPGPAIKQVNNCEANDVGPIIMNGCAQVQVLVNKSLTW